MAERKPDLRINVKAKPPLLDKLSEVSKRTGIAKSTLVRDFVYRGLIAVEQEHPAYAKDRAAEAATTA